MCVYIYIYLSIYLSIFFFMEIDHGGNLGGPRAKKPVQKVGLRTPTQKNGTRSG